MIVTLNPNTITLIHCFRGSNFLNNQYLIFHYNYALHAK